MVTDEGGLAPRANLLAAVIKQGLPPGDTSHLLGQESVARGSNGQHAGIWGAPQQQRRLPKSRGSPAAAVGLRGARCVRSARCLHQLPAGGGPRDTDTLPGTHGTTSPNSAPGPARHSPFREKKPTTLLSYINCIKYTNLFYRKIPVY